MIGTRVLQLTQRFPPALGGVESHVANLATRLVAQGHSVNVVTSDLKRDRPFQRIDEPAMSYPFTVHRCSALKLADAPHGLGVVAPGMLRESFSEVPDLIHAHAYGFFPTFVGSFASRLRAIPLVITPHADPGRDGNAKRLFDAVVPPMTLRAADRVVALTQAEARYLHGLGISEERIAVVPNAIDADEFVPAARATRNGDGDRILFVGRCYPEQKGLVPLVQAIARLPTSTRLRIVGEDWGGHALVRDLAARLGIADRVELAGKLPRPDVLREYAQAQIFVLPSLFDSFPIVLLEAMASGLPIVATRVGGVAEILEDGRCGLLVSPGDPVALANALQRLRDDEGLRRGLGARARERVQDFSWDAVVSRIGRVYEEAIRERAS